MQIKLLLSLLLTLILAGLYAQDVEIDNKVDSVIRKSRSVGDTSFWVKSIEFGLTFNQAQFSDNWQGGGINSIAFAGSLSAKLERQMRRFNWNNDLLLQYGMLRNDGQQLRKNQDQIFFDTKLGYNISKSWDVFGAVNFISQFADGFRFATDSNGKEVGTLISRFMSPGFLTEAFGLKFQPKNFFFIRFGFVAFRQTFVLDTTLYRTEPLNFGVPVGQRVLNQTGLQILSDFNKDIMKNLNARFRYLGFMPYDRPENFVHRVDILFTAKVNKFFSTQLGATFIKDPKQNQDWQFSQTFNFGFLWKVRN
jgi:hypothetical protein